MIKAQLGRVFQQGGTADDHPYIPSHFVIAGRLDRGAARRRRGSGSARAPTKLLGGLVTLKSTLNPKPEDAQKAAAVDVAVDLEPFTLRAERAQLRFCLELAAKVATFQVFARYHGCRPQDPYACSAPALVDLDYGVSASGSAASGGASASASAEQSAALEDTVLLEEASEQRWCAAWWRYALTAMKQDVLAEDGDGGSIDNQPWAVVIQRRLDLKQYVDMYMYKNDRALYLSAVAQGKGTSERAAKKAHKGDAKAINRIEAQLSVAEIELFRTQALKRLKTVRREKKRLDDLRQAAAVAKKEEKKLKKTEKKMKKKEKSNKTPNLFRWGKRVLGKKKKVSGDSSDGAGAEGGAAGTSPSAVARSASQVLSARDAVAAATDADDEFAATLQNLFEANMDEDDDDVEEMFWRTEKGHPLDFLLKLTVRQTEAALVVACEQGDVCCVFRGLDVNLSLRRKFVDLGITLHDLTMRDESVADTGSDFAYMLKQTKRVATEPFVRVKLGLPPHEILDPPLPHTEPRPQVHVELEVRPLQAAFLPSLIARVSHFFLVVLHVQDVGAIGKMASSPLKQFEEAGKMHVEAIKSAAKQGISKGELILFTVTVCVRILLTI